VRVADGHDELADAQVVGLAKVRGLEVRAVGTQHREVRQRIAAHHLEAEVAAVGELRTAPAAPPGHHVGRGEQEAVRREHHARAGAHHAQVGHGRSHLLGHAHDGARVGVQGLELLLGGGGHENETSSSRSSVPRTTVSGSLPSSGSESSAA